MTQHSAATAATAPSSARPPGGAETGPPASPTKAPGRSILVWDAPVRVFHWLLAASFLGAFITAESERWRLLHVTLGYTVGGLVVFRVLWGLFGTRHARFKAFVRGPRAVSAYLRSLLSGRAEHHVGHNPAGAWAIVAILASAAVVVGSGWANYNDLGGGWLEDLHEVVGNAMMALVVVHVLGVIVSSRLHHENLVRAMFSGRKSGKPAEAIGSAWRSVAVLMLVAVLGFWSWQWTQAPVGPSSGPSSGAVSAGAHRADRDHDDD
jgi:cytochrome b